MYTTFMNSKNSKTFYPHRLLLNLTENMDLKRSDQYAALSNLSIYYTWKIRKSHIRAKNLKNRLQHGMKSLNYMMVHNLYQIFKIVLNLSQKIW